MSKIDIIIANNKSKIETWISENYPKEWIAKQLGISRDAFAKRFPNYKGSMGVSGEQRKQRGAVDTVTKECEHCSKPFNASGSFYNRSKKRFCSRSCAAVRDQSKRISQYTTICKKHHEFKCCVCGFDKVVDVHHLDENRNNNTPQNLIPLCPNHHRMWHNSQYKAEVDGAIQAYLRKKFS